MSSKNRAGSESIANDDYQSPQWTVLRFIEKFCVEQGHRLDGPLLEPCAGMGNIITVFNSREIGYGWDAVEIQEKYALYLKQPFVRDYCPMDFLTWEPNRCGYAAVVTNPPYTLAMDFVLKSLTISSVVIMLLRVGFLGSIERHEFMKQTHPDVYGPLVPRPSFALNGTDSSEYGWFVWAPWAEGRIYSLELGPVRNKKKQPREFDPGSFLMNR